MIPHFPIFYLFIYLFFLFAKTPTHQPTHSFSLIITLFFLHFLGGPLYTQPNTHAWPKIFAILPSFFSSIFFIHPLAKTLADPHFLFQFFFSSSCNPSQTRPHDHTSSTLLSSLFFLLDFFYSSSYHHSFTCSNTTTISHISTRTTFFFFILLSHLLHLILNFFSFSLLLVLFSKTQPFITASETTTSRCWRAIAYQWLPHSSISSTFSHFLISSILFYFIFSSILFSFSIFHSQPSSLLLFHPSKIWNCLSFFFSLILIVIVVKIGLVCLFVGLMFGLWDLGMHIGYLVVLN